MHLMMVCNLLTHYRLPLYRSLQSKAEVDLVFYSDGQEWYWQGQPTASPESLHSAITLDGRWIGRTRITPSLVPVVLRSNADVIVKDPNGKFAIPATYVAARLRRKPFVFWASMWEHPTHGIHRFTAAAMRYIYRHSDAVVTYGHHVSHFVVSQGADPARTIVSPQAVASKPVPPTPARWEGTVRLLYVGRLESWKGVQVLLEALRGLREEDWHLDIVGRGSQREHLEAYAHEHCLGDRITFAGFVPHEELSRWYARAAAVVIPSVRTADFSEPWSLVANEAMQTGNLVIASSAVGAVADGLVSHGETGLVFAEGSSPSLSNALNACMTQRAEAIEMAQRGHRAIRAYTHENAAQAFVDAAQTALDHHATRSRV